MRQKDGIIRIINVRLDGSYSNRKPGFGSLTLLALIKLMTTPRFTLGGTRKRRLSPIRHVVFCLDPSGGVR